MMSLPSPMSTDYSVLTGDSLETLHSSSSSSTMFSCSETPSVSSSTTSKSCKKVPSLDDILANDAPYPYNLTSFIGFLSQNHCLETVEFTMDVAKYTASYSTPCMSKQILARMWHKVVDTYIRTDGPKELNLSCEVKLELTKLSEEVGDGEPPEPVLLKSSVDMVKDMIKDNAYLPFISSIRCSQALPQYVALPRRNSAQPRPDSCLQQLDTPAYMCQSLPSNTVTPFESNSSDSCWHQPTSWAQCSSSINSSRRSLSKASSSDSLFLGDEELGMSTRTAPMTPPESPSSTNLSDFDIDEAKSPATITVRALGENRALAAVPARTHSHWRKMSKRLKWRRGSDNHH